MGVWAPVARFSDLAESIGTPLPVSGWNEPGNCKSTFSYWCVSRREWGNDPQKSFMMIPAYSSNPQQPIHSLRSVRTSFSSLFNHDKAIFLWCPFARLDSWIPYGSIWQYDAIWLGPFAPFGSLSHTHTWLHSQQKTEQINNHQHLNSQKDSCCFSQPNNGLKDPTGRNKLLAPAFSKHRPAWDTGDTEFWDVLMEQLQEVAKGEQFTYVVFTKNRCFQPSPSQKTMWARWDWNILKPFPLSGWFMALF